MTNLESIGDSPNLIGLIITAYVMNSSELNILLQHMYYVAKDKKIRAQFKSKLKEEVKDIKGMLLK